MAPLRLNPSQARALLSLYQNRTLPTVRQALAMAPAAKATTANKELVPA